MVGFHPPNYAKVAKACGVVKAHAVATDAATTARTGNLEGTHSGQRRRA